MCNCLQEIRSRLGLTRGSRLEREGGWYYLHHLDDYEFHFSTRGIVNLRHAVSFLGYPKGPFFPKVEGCKVYANLFGNGLIFSDGMRARQRKE